MDPESQRDDFEPQPKVKRPYQYVESRWKQDWMSEEQLAKQATKIFLSEVYDLKARQFTAEGLSACERLGIDPQTLMPRGLNHFLKLLNGD